MATKDFSAKQIRASQLLASGGISGTGAGLAIYSASNASNLEGGLSDSSMFSGVGSDVLLFVSGAANQRSSVSLFGGDVVISGTLYAERQVIEVDETTSGSLSVSGSLYVQQGAQINLEAGSTYPDNTFQITSNQGTAFAAYGSPADVDASQPAVYVNPANAQIDFFVKTDGSKSAIVVDAQREYIAFMSGGTGDVPEAANPRTMTDVNFLVSGSIGGKGSANRGVAVFNGDAVISGTLYPGGNTDQFISSDGTEIIIDGNDHVDIRIDESFGVYTAAGGTSKPILGVFNNDGTEGRGTVINTNGLSYLDFRVESDNKLGSILVDGGTEQVAILVNSKDASTAYGGDAIPTEIDLFVSGTIGGKGTEGVAVFGGDVVMSGSLDVNSVSVTTDGKVGIGTTSPSYKLEVGGNAAFGEYLYHRGDADTFIQFADDAIGITAGGEQLITISEATQDIVKIGDGGDVDFQVRTLNDDNTLYVLGELDRVGIGTNSPSEKLHVAGDVLTTGTRVILLSGSAMAASSMQPKETNDINFFVSGSVGSKGTSTRGTSVFGGDLVVSGTYRGGYDSNAGYESFQAVSDSYLFLTNLADFGGSQIEATDSNFFFTGSIGSRGVGPLGTAVFGGDVVASGSAYTYDSLTGSISPVATMTRTFHYLNIVHVDIKTLANRPDFGCFLNVNGIEDPGNHEDFGIKYIAPANGRVEKVNFVPTNLTADINSANDDDGFASDDNIVFFMIRNEIAHSNIYAPNNLGTGNTIEPTMHLTASSGWSNFQNFSFYNYQGSTRTQQTTRRVLVDVSSPENIAYVSGSNSFARGDILIFGTYFANRGTHGNANLDNGSINITLSFDESLT